MVSEDGQGVCEGEIELMSLPHKDPFGLDALSKSSVDLDL